MCETGKDERVMDWTWFHQLVLCIPELCVWNIQLEDGLVCCFLIIFFRFHLRQFTLLTIFSSLY